MFRVNPALPETFSPPRDMIDIKLNLLQAFEPLEGSVLDLRSGEFHVIVSHDPRETRSKYRRPSNTFTSTSAEVNRGGNAVFGHTITW